jgi:hypothetical protein
MDRLSCLSRLGYASRLPRNTQEMVKETQRSIAISLALIEKAKKENAPSNEMEILPSYK